MDSTPHLSDETNEGEDADAVDGVPPADAGTPGRPADHDAPDEGEFDAGMGGAVAPPD